jgi:hypothetical protein
MLVWWSRGGASARGGTYFLLVNTLSLRVSSSYAFVTGADIKTGAVFCRQCNDFIYDAKLDEIYVSTVVAAEEKLTKFQGELYSAL